MLAGNMLIVAGTLFLCGPVAHRLSGVRAQGKQVFPASARSASPSRHSPRPADGEALGRLEVPRLGLDLVVFEGTSEATLRKGPGHLPGTAWPGGPDETGNCVISGHRDSFFRRLADARKDDLVRLHGPSGTSTYRLGEGRIVLPKDLSVIAPTSDARLTLITCYPFSWTGAAPYRLVWSAARIEPASPAESLRISDRRSP
jgi:sortase A